MASYLFCCFLLQLLFGAVLTGTKINKFSGTSFELFSNLTFHQQIILYRNGNEKSVIIARWEMENATITQEWKKDEYMTKIFFVVDITPFILICKGDEADSAKYEVIYDIGTPGPKVELTIRENKQLDVCLNNPPNSPEKCFGKLTDEQVVKYIEKFLDDHPQYIKRIFGNLTEDEFQNWLDNHPGFMKKYFGCRDSLMIGLQISILVIVVLAIIIFIIVWTYKKFCSEPKQSSKSHYKHKAVPTGGSGETTSMLPKLSEKDKMEPPRGDEIFHNETVQKETAQSNETNVVEPDLQFTVYPVPAHQASGHTHPL